MIYGIDDEIRRFNGDSPNMKETKSAHFTKCPVGAVREERVPFLHYFYPATQVLCPHINTHLQSEGSTHANSLVHLIEAHV